MTGNAIEVVHADRLGSVRALSDATGAVVATYRTDEWGIPTGSTGSSSQPFGYTGEPTDASGLSYLRARFYDPSLGRFLSRDPFAGFVGSPLSLNRFSYVTNNPATSSDPSGRCPLIPAGAATGAAVGAVGGAGVGAIPGAVTGAGVGALGCAAIFAGAAIGAALVGAGLGLGYLEATKDQRYDAPIPQVYDGWRRDMPYDPPMFQHPDGEGPLGPRGPGRHTLATAALITLGVAVTVKLTRILRPQ